MPGSRLLNKVSVELSAPVLVINVVDMSVCELQDATVMEDEVLQQKVTLFTEFPLGLTFPRILADLPVT